MVLAALAYLVLALFVLRSVLPSPGRLLPYPELLDWESVRNFDLTRLDHRDQSMVVSVVTRNAAILTSEPWNLRDGFGQCYPMPRSYTLGEHMFGVGMLAALPYLVTGDPLLSYNAALVLTLWIPGLTMFALSWAFTRNAAAAFVAGMLFLLVPGRIVDPSHPYVHGDLWAPLVLLFLYRLFALERWRDALLFALFLSLEVFESLYPLLATSLLVLVCGTWLALRNWRKLVRLGPKIAVASVIVLASVWYVLAPYLTTRDLWGLLEGRTSVMLGVRDYGFGTMYFPGVMVLGLAALGLADRLRGARRRYGEDPRLAVLAAGFLIFWCSTSGLPVPFTDVLLPSPIELAKPYVPGLNAVRALNAINITTSLALAFVAGYGVLLLARRRIVAIATAALATALTIAFLYHGRFAKPMFAVWSFKLAPWAASPPAEDVALLRRVADGAVLDLPFPEMEKPSSVNLARHLLLNAYSPRATAACYNSFVSPVQEQIAALSQRLPARDAADALAALGFGTLILDKVRFDPADLQAFYEGLRDLDVAQRIYPLGKTGRLLAYRITSDAPVRSDLALIAGSTAPPSTARRGANGRATIELVFTNRGDATFRLPDPIAPDAVIVRWRDHAGTVVATTRTRVLLPMALAAGASFPITLEVVAPAATGRYTVELAREAAPDAVLTSRTIELLPPA
jgi:hypothetical protein